MQSSSVGGETVFGAIGAGARGALKLGGRRASGPVASVGNTGSPGYYSGTVEDLVMHVRTKNRPWLDRIADRYTDPDTATLVNLLNDVDFEVHAARHFGNPKGVAAFYYGAEIYLRRSRGHRISREFVHEATHAIDCSPGGVFAGVDPVDMTPAQILRRELRAYLAERIYDPSVYPKGHRRALVQHIVETYF